MTGLLQRLGARATGTAWPVRADARLPFGAERMAPLPAAADTVAEEAAEAAEAAAQPRGAPQRQRAGTGPAAAPCAAEALPQALLPAARTLQQADPAQAIPASQPATRLQQHPDTPAAPQRISARAPDAPDASDAPDAQPQSDDEPARTATQAARAFAAATDAPTPLLPTTAGTASPQPPARHAAWPTAIGTQHSPTAAPQETEVHIHIGRIDVTALHEAPRAKAKPRERAQPMSLDAYLARRKGAT